MSASIVEQQPGVRFPGESDEYRRARNDLLEAEIALRRQSEAVAAQRRRLPVGDLVPADYAFEEWDAGECAARTVRLSELFEAGRDTLFVYSFMFNPGPTGRPLEVACPMCTSMLDAVDGQLPHIAQHISFAVAAKAPIERSARTRGRVAGATYGCSVAVVGDPGPHPARPGSATRIPVVDSR